MNQNIDDEQLKLLRLELDETARSFGAACENLARALQKVSASIKWVSDELEKAGVVMRQGE